MRRHAISGRLNKASFNYAWLGCVEYDAAEVLQHRIATERMRGETGDSLLLLEHPHTYTLGRSASRADILFNQDECDAQSIKVYRCDRGGQVTYHGPGQLVGYVILDLRSRRMSVPQFVWHVEEAVRVGLKQLGCESERRPGRPGLWRDGRKLASLGFHISRGISRHGFSINVDPKLAYYDGIIPCGAKLPITSLCRELDRTVDMPEVRAALLAAFDQVFSGSTAKGSLGSSSKTNSLIESSVSSS